MGWCSLRLHNYHPPTSIAKLNGRAAGRLREGEMAAQEPDTFETIRGAFAGRPFVAVLLVAAGARVVATAATGGFVVADEIFQYLEPAFRHVHGYGEVPWEYVLGARSWLLPGVYAILMRLLDLAGVTSPLAFAAVFHALNAAASVF